MPEFLKVRESVEKNLGAIRLEARSKVFFILHLPEGAPDGTGEAFLRGWREAKAGPPSVLGAPLPRADSAAEMRKTCRSRLEAYLAGHFHELCQACGGEDAVWSLDCPRGAWGRCQPDTRRIRLYPGLCWMPEAVVDEVVLHELCHLRCFEHSPAFWERLTQLCPLWPYEEGRLRGTKEGMAHVFPV